ncbi:MAG: hypothetical protein M2R45_02428 [Verrucomicrobia subdivision 3 bacterium]|nr:hypothetical protein [Limisphaerales bacterium]MCS1416367.1 hypothetical protein [Limisphaerales bacterium]
MPRIHIFIDGSWLFKVAGPDHVLAAKTDRPDCSVRLDFARLDQSLLRHVRNHADCEALGTRYFATSIFMLPDDLDNWPAVDNDIRPDRLRHIRRVIHARNEFVNNALDAGYSGDAVVRPSLRPWILKRLISKDYQEKQVDTMVVALLVRSAIMQPEDYHCIITGDADILPAVQVTYSDTSNVFVATTHPDELCAEHRHTAFSLANFEFRIPPFYLQDNLAQIIAGNHIYTCAYCSRIFTRREPIPKNTPRPCCSFCHRQRRQRPRAKRIQNIL